MSPDKVFERLTNVFERSAKVFGQLAKVFMLPAKVFVLQTKVVMPLGKHYERQSTVFMYHTPVTG